VPINNQILPPDAPRNLLSEVLPPTASKSWKKPASSTWACRFPAWALPYQRHAPARQLRGGDSAHHRSDIPRWIAEPAARPADLIMEKRGLILMVGATGSGKSTTLASMIDTATSAHRATS
jgi:twitching motility protein PilU